MHDLLQSALTPRSIAVLGASDSIHKMGGRPIYYMRKHGYAGRIFPINPARREVQGLPAWPSLAALPEVPELAMVVVGGDSALDAVRQCALLGVKSAVVVASGFAETGDAGRRIQEEMVMLARSAGMRLFGPNTQGLANFGSGAIASFSTMFVEHEPCDGPVGIVSQSGGMSAMSYGLLRERGVGVRHMHATGNEADVSVADLAWAVAHDPDVRLLLLYMESIANPTLLAETAAHARERGLPIVAVKAGRSESGQKAASSHTGSLANEDRVVDAFFRHHGIWRVKDIHEQTLAAEAYLKGWRPRGRRLVIVSNSGASCVMGADAAEDHGLEIARLAPATQERVAAGLPGFATATNPIDVTAALLSDSRLFGNVLPALAQDPAVDMFFVHVPVAGAGYDIESMATDTAAFVAQTGKPVVVAAWQDTVSRPFRQRGIPVFANEDDALRTLAQLTSHTALLQRNRPVWPHREKPSIPARTGPWLNEAESLAILREAGIDVVQHRLCRDADAARQAFESIGAPVVVKACSKDVPHKSEFGLVALDIRSAAHAVDTFEDQTAKVAALAASPDGILVAKMHKGRLELMVGAHVDPVFGPVVVFGSGGKYVEAMEDVALLMPPFSEADVIDALQGLRIAPLLSGVRGERPKDVEAFARSVVRLGQLIVAARGAINSIDANPVLVGARGEGAIVADALVACENPIAGAAA